MPAGPAPLVRTAVVPAAGLGTRLLPATLAVSKEMLPLGTHPALCATLLEALGADLGELVVVAAPGKRDLRRFLDPGDWGPAASESALQPLWRLLSALRLRLVEQPEPLGVLDAVEQGLREHPPGEPYALLFPDLIHLPDQRGLGALLSAYAACHKTVYGLHDAGRPAPGTHGPTARVVLAQPLSGSLGSPWPIARVEAPSGPARPGELRTTFGAIHTAAHAEAQERTARPRPGAPLDDRRVLDTLNALAERGELYGVLLPGEVIDIGVVPGYLDATRRFASGEARLRGLSP